MAVPPASGDPPPFPGWWGDIRFWIVVVFLVRLIGITQPPIEASHSWRQAFTNMVARNLVEGPFDLLYPRTDMAGERPDVVASEFPVFNTLIASTAKVFGYAHWYGRLWALLFSSLGTLAFHALVRAGYGARVAFFAAFVFLWSSWFVYGRKSMPDTFSISLLLLALLAVHRAVRCDRPWWLVPAVLLAAAGGMSKIPAVVLLTPWAVGCLERHLPSRMRWALGASFATAMVPVLWWYFMWLPHLLETYGNPLFFPRSITEGLSGLAQHGSKLLERFRFSALLSHLAALGMLAGAWFFFRDAGRPARIAFCASLLLFVHFMIRAGDVFALHAYYMLPLVPVMALLAGIAFARLPSKAWSVAVACAVVVEGGGIRWNDLVNTDRSYLLALENKVAPFAAPDDLIATSGGMDPRIMYFAHRHGWSLEPEQLRTTRTLDSLGTLGLHAIVVDRATFDEILPRPLLFQDEHLRIYDGRKLP